MDISTQFKRSAIATAVCAALLAPQASLGEVPYFNPLDTPEQQVNTSTLATSKPTVAMDADGDFVVVWNSNLSNCNVTARKYNSDGSPATAEITVDSRTTSCYFQPDVAMDADGDFVVAWTAFDPTGILDVLAQRYDSSGTAQGSAISVASSTLQEMKPRVAMDADGDFAVAWEEWTGVVDRDLYLQRYDSSGTAQGTRQLMHAVSTLGQTQPDIAMDADGDLVAVWSDNNSAVKARQFPLGGTAGAEFTVTSITTNADQPRVVADADGDFVVSWGTSTQLFVRGFDKSGTQSIAETVVASLDGISVGDLAMDADGDFAVTWGYTVMGTPDVTTSYLNLYDRTGATSVGTQVNNSVDGGEASNSVAMDADGDMVVAWEPDYFGSDGGNNNTYFRRYQGREDVDLAVATSATPAPVPVNGSLTYTATVTNNHAIVAGTSASQNLYFSAVGAATGVTLSDTLPVGTSYVSASGTDWSCSDASGTVSCSLSGSVLPTSSGALDITVTAPATVTTLSNSATVAANQLDTVTANNSDTLAIATCNDYGTISLGAATASVAEDGATTTLAVSRSGGSCGAVSVDYASVDGTATAGADYTATSGTLNWAAGDTTDKSITITISDDTAVESDEAFTVGLSNPGLASLGSTTEAIVTITDNDVVTCNDYGTIALSTATTSVAEDGGSATLTVSRSGGSCDAVSIDYASADWNATAGADYSAVTGTLNWAAGDSADKSITITISDDIIVEGDEAFTVSLSNPGLATLGGTTGAMVIITDNDVATGGGGGTTDPWWLALLSLPLLRRRRR